MPNKHRWFNFDDDIRRCTYCGLRWHPVRENAECQAEFPISEHSDKESTS